MQIVMAPAGSPDDPPPERPTAVERCPPTAVQAGVRVSWEEEGQEGGRKAGRKSSHEIGLTIQLGKR